MKITMTAAIMMMIMIVYEEHQIKTHPNICIYKYLYYMYVYQ